MASKSDKRALEAYNALKAYCKEQCDLCSACLFSDVNDNCIFEFEVYPCQWQTLELDE